MTNLAPQGFMALLLLALGMAVLGAAQDSIVGIASVVDGDTIGMEPEDAISNVRAVRPGAIETNDQEEYIRNVCTAPK